MKLRHLACAASLGLALLNCNGKTVDLGGGASTKAGESAGGADSWTFVAPTTVPALTASNKVDILLAVDNSTGMAGKSQLLAQSLKAYLDKVATKTSDIHLGIVTSSLGTMGGDVCPEDATHDGLSHLQRDGVVAPNGVLALTQASDLPAFEASAAKLVGGVGQGGCGFEAQLESMYRFLVQPDPWDHVLVDEFDAAYLGTGIDAQVLADRKAFLRPDSLLVVLMLTDEDDSSADPLAVGGFGWGFEARQFPGSEVQRQPTVQGTTAPRPTAICATDPANASCTSCGFAANCDTSAASCQTLRRDPNCTADPGVGRTGYGYSGFYPPADDDLNVRFLRMKQRFGVDPQFPLDRYVAGFNSSAVPNRAAEHAVTFQASNQRTTAAYTHHNTCTNPIFAQSLPASTGDELCNLPRGPRTPAFVQFGLLTGVPTDLADTATPNWAAIVGNDPVSYDYTGIDPRMVPSDTPRAGLGNDWDTRKQDLEFACTFQRATPLDCTTASDECVCNTDYAGPRPLLCSTTVPTQQVLDKAYPATRELEFARKTNGLIGSICQPASTGYAGFLGRLGDAAVAKLTP